MHSVLLSSLDSGAAVTPLFREATSLRGTADGPHGPVERPGAA